jgi:hypothetical protein
MSEYGQVVLAAQFTGDMLTAHALVMSWPEPRLELSFSSHTYASWRYRSWVNGNPLSGNPELVWPLPDVDPLHMARLSVPAHATLSTPTVSRYCSECGTPRAGDGGFCGNCGNRFPQAESEGSAIAVLRDAIAGPDLAGNRLAQLVDELADLSSLSADARWVLPRFIALQMQSPRITALDIENEPDLPLTLSKAQAVRDVVAQGSVLTDEQSTWTELVLTQAPFVFGYWSTFKALLKKGPFPGLEAAHGLALSRLIKNDGWRWKHPKDVQDISPLEEMCKAASPVTLQYMRRRTRRDLSRLALRDADAYTQVSIALLKDWNQRLWDHAFAPAYVILGKAGMNAVTHMRIDGWWPDVPVPHIDAWRAHAGRVEAVLKYSNISPELFAWAFRVLDGCGYSPRLTPKTLTLALRCPDRRLWDAALRMAHEAPESLIVLTRQRWLLAFQEAPFDLLKQLIDVYTAIEKRSMAADDNLGDAAAKVLHSEDVSTDVKVMAADLYFELTAMRDRKWIVYVNKGTDALALLILFGASAIHDDEHGRRLLNAVDADTLISVFSDLGEGGEEAAFVRRMILERADRVEVGLLAKRVASTGSEPLNDLLWNVVDQANRFQNTSSEIIASLLATDAMVAGVVLLLQGIMSRSQPGQVASLIGTLGQANTEFDFDAAVDLFLRSPAGIQGLWNYMVRGEPDELAEVIARNPIAIRLIGDGISAPQALTADGLQLLMLVEYLNMNPERLGVDSEFARVAATSTDTTLQTAAVASLQYFGHVPNVWLQLAESALPATVQVARHYLESLRGVAEIERAVLACLDSGVQSAREIGLDLLHANQPVLAQDHFWLALAESDEPSVQKLVAEELLVRDLSYLSADFDRRVLTARRRNRSAKEAIKKRLDQAGSPIMSDPDRVTALMNLARSRNRRDSEWAMTRIADLALRGIEIEGASVSLTSGASA